jgi:hypothetical protein
MTLQILIQSGIPAGTKLPTRKLRQRPEGDPPLPAVDHLDAE